MLTSLCSFQRDRAVARTRVSIQQGNVGGFRQQGRICGDMYALWLGDDGLPWKVGVSAVDRVHSLGLCLVTLSFRLLHSMRPTHDLSQWLGERGHLPLQVSKNRRGDAAGGNSPYVYILTGVFDGPK